MGRPSLPKPKKKVLVAFRIHEDNQAGLTALIKRTGISQSELLRLALARFLNNKGRGE